jgi:hypothetical protein
MGENLYSRQVLGRMTYLPPPSASLKRDSPVWDFSITLTLKALFRTLPFLVLRMMVYFGAALAFIFTTLIGAALGYGLGSIGDQSFRSGAIVLGALFGFGAVGSTFYFMRSYILYMVKAGHIAVLTELLNGNEIPEGETQIAYARQVVGQRFPEANALFVLDQTIKGVIRMITSVFNAFASATPLPAIDGLMNFFNTVTKISLGYIDEVILAYNIHTKSTNPWASSKDALILYAQNGWTMLKNAMALTIISWILTIIIFMFLLTPTAAVLYVFPGHIGNWSFVAAFLLAWAFKVSIMEPFAIACLMQVFFKAIEGQTPSPEWEARLNNASEKFRELGAKATQSFRGQMDAPMGLSRH